jgi:hypothetical protein
MRNLIIIMYFNFQDVSLPLSPLPSASLEKVGLPPPAPPPPKVDRYFKIEQMEREGKPKKFGLLFQVNK